MEVRGGCVGSNSMSTIWLLLLCIQLLQSLPSALVSPTTGLQTILISPQAVTKPVTQTVTVASSPATPVVTVAPSAAAGVTIGTVAAVQPNQSAAQQFPVFRMPEVSDVLT